MFSVKTIYLGLNQLTCCWCSPSKLFSSSPSKRCGAKTAIIDGKESLVVATCKRFTHKGGFVACLVCGRSVLLGVLLVQAQCAVAALSAVPYFLLSLFLVIRLAWDLRRGDTASYWVTSIVLAWEENSLTVALPSQGHVGKGYKRCGGAWTCLESDAPV